MPYFPILEAREKQWNKLDFTEITYETEWPEYQETGKEN